MPPPYCMILIARNMHICPTELKNCVIVGVCRTDIYVLDMLEECYVLSVNFILSSNRGQLTWPNEKVLFKSNFVHILSFWHYFISRPFFFLCRLSISIWFFPWPLRNQWTTSYHYNYSHNRHIYKMYNKKKKSLFRFVYEEPTGVASFKHRMSAVATGDASCQWQRAWEYYRCC